MRNLVFCLMSIVLAASAFAAVRFNPDLAKMDENRAAIKKVIADPKASAYDKLVAQFDDLKWELFTCEDKDLPARKAAMTKLIAERGAVEKPVYLRFLYEVVSRDGQNVMAYPDIWEIADRESKGDERLRREYYSRRISSMVYANRGRGTIDPEKGPDARLKLIDQMEKDPAFAKKPDVADYRCECLIDLGRFDAAEQLMLERAATTNVAVRKVWLNRLGDFYNDRAERYYADRDPATLRKIVGVSEQKLACDPDGKDARFSRKALAMKASALTALGELVAARQAADGQVRFTKDGKGDFDLAKQYASIAYKEGKWGEVVDWLSPYADKLDADWNETVARALCAAGRRAETVPYLEAASKKCRNKYKRDGYNYLYKKLKSETAQ